MAFHKAQNDFNATHPKEPSKDWLVKWKTPEKEKFDQTIAFFQKKNMVLVIVMKS
jgi:hypothetical protein